MIDVEALRSAIANAIDALDLEDRTPRRRAAA